MVIGTEVSSNNRQTIKFRKRLYGQFHSTIANKTFRLQADLSDQVKILLFTEDVTEHMFWKYLFPFMLYPGPPRSIKLI